MRRQNITKYCSKCYKAFADRFNFCAICGNELEVYDGNYREDDSINHGQILEGIRQIYDNMQELERKIKNDEEINIRRNIQNLGITIVVLGLSLLFADMMMLAPYTKIELFLNAFNNVFYYCLLVLFIGMLLVLLPKKSANFLMRLLKFKK